MSSLSEVDPQISAAIEAEKQRQAGTLEMIADRSRGTPRVANRLLKRVRDYAQVKGDGILTDAIVKNALEMEQIDSLIGELASAA